MTDTNAFRALLIIISFFVSLFFAFLWFVGYKVSGVNLKPVIIALPFILVTLMNLPGYHRRLRPGWFSAVFTLIAFLAFHGTRYLAVIHSARPRMLPRLTMRTAALIEIYPPIQFLMEQMNFFDVLFLLVALLISFSYGNR